MQMSVFIKSALIIFLLVPLALAQGKSKPAKKEPATDIKTSYQKTYFLDINGKEIGQSEFADKIFAGEVGLKSFTNAKGKNVQHTPLTEIVLTEAENVISILEYRTKLESGKYKFEEITENGEVTGLRLKPYPMLEKPAPDFLAVTLENEAFTLANQKGKLTVLNFWFIGCVPCMEELPSLNKIVKKYNDNSDITFLAVSIDSTPRLKEFLTKNFFDFQIVHDKSGMTKNFQANINGFPTTVVIDRNGQIVLYRSYLGKDAVFLDRALRDELGRKIEK